jgi:class 3 adenylate cyclase
MSGAGTGTAGPNHSAPDPPAGRAVELDALRRWLSEALGGSPRITVVSGDAGIGKSRLVSHLVHEARAAGVRPFAGRCLEDAAVPLLPFASLFDALGTADAIGAPAPVAPGGGDDVSAGTPIVTTSRALMELAVDRPVLLVVEDVQWADGATLDLLGHLAAALTYEAVYRQLPLMLTVTARPSGVLPPAGRLIGRLRDEVIGRDLPLRGLDDLALFDLLTAETGHRPSTELLGVVRRATGGNPHRVRELLARLDAAGALEVQGRERTTHTVDVHSLAPVHPADARLAGQLDALPDPAVELVTTLALLRDGRLRILAWATGLAPGEFEVALDAATDAGLVSDDGDRIDFVHAADAAAIASRMGGRRRQRRHAEIARRLAAAPERDTFALMEIADQLQRAGDRADPALVEECTVGAGDQAASLGAWLDALRYYDLALDRRSPGDPGRAALSLRAALAAYRTLDRPAAARHAQESVTLARASGDLRTWGEAALLAARASGDTRALEELAGGAGDHERDLRALAHATIAELRFDQLRLTDAARHVDEAESLVRELEQPATSARVEFVLGLCRYGQLDLQAAARHFGRCEHLAREADDALVEAWAAGRAPLVTWARGALADAAHQAADAAARDREHGWWAEYSLLTAARAGIAVALGNLGAAERFAAEAASAHRHAEHPGVAGMLWTARASARILAGDVDGAHAAVDAWAAEDRRPAFLYRRLVDALGGRDSRSDWDPSGLVRAGAPADLSSLALAAAAVELADAECLPALASRALPVLTDGYARGIRFVPGWCTFLPRAIGVAHGLAGAPEQATSWLERAGREAREHGAAIEVARARLDALRLRAGGGDDVGEQLDGVAEELDRLGCGLLAQRARRAGGAPEPAGRPADTGAGRVILVTDLIDSTPLTRRVGDRRFVELLREHNRIMRTRLRQFDGVEFKHTGDGIAAWFLSAAAAVECALRMQNDLERANASRPTDPMHVRIGIAAGEVVTEGDQVYGIAVITAFRICDHARDAPVLVSAAVPPLVRDARVEFRPVGEVVLKGFVEPSALFAVRERSGDTATATP